MKTILYLSLIAATAAGPGPLMSAPALSGHSVYQLDSSWTDDSGGSVKLSMLRGQPVVLALFYTQCASACPVIVSEMKRVRAALPPKSRAHFVLASFDSERDTPEALRAYRRQMGLDQESWVLLRGDAADVRELAMVLGIKYSRNEGGQFAHSNMITVLNAEGEIVHQRPGLQGDLSGLVRAVAKAAPR